MDDQFAEIRDHFLAALERDGLEAQLGPVVAKLLPAATWPADLPDNQESRLRKLPNLATNRFRESSKDPESVVSFVFCLRLRPETLVRGSRTVCFRQACPRQKNFAGLVGARRRGWQSEEGGACDRRLRAARFGRPGAVDVGWRRG